MKPLNNPIDVTVQKLLCLDCHLLDDDNYRAISGLIQRCEIAQLERIQASISQQLQKNWPAPQWYGALRQLFYSHVLLSQRNRVVQSDLPLSMLLLQANARLRKCRHTGNAASAPQIKSVSKTAECSLAPAGAIASAA